MRQHVRRMLTSNHRLTHASLASAVRNAGASACAAFLPPRVCLCNLALVSHTVTLSSIIIRRRYARSLNSA